MAGNEPTIVTKTTARSVAPNQITASGTHATNGVICSATTSGRIDRRANSLSASISPSAVPIATATTKENARRIRVFAAASGSVPSRIPSRNADQTVAGEGIDVVAARIAHTTIAPAIPASGGPSSLPSHLARDTRVDLLHQQLVDLGDDASHQHVVEGPRPGRVDPELLEQPPRRRRHHQDAIGEQRRLADVVRHEQEGRSALGPEPDPLDLPLEELARLRVERAEGLVAEQNLGVGGERARERRSLPHPG